MLDWTPERTLLWTCDHPPCGKTSFNMYKDEWYRICVPTAKRTYVDFCTYNCLAMWVVSKDK